MNSGVSKANGQDIAKESLKLRKAVSIAMKDTQVKELG